MFNEATKERIVTLFASLKESKKQKTPFKDLAYLEVKSDTSKNAYNIGKFKSIIAKEINSTAREVQEFLVEKELVSIRKKKKAPKAKKAEKVKILPPTYVAFEGNIKEVLPGIFKISLIANDPEKKGEYTHHSFLIPKERFDVIK